MQNHRLKRFSSVCAAALCIIFLATAKIVSAGGWLANSAWPCFRHDARHTGQSPYIGAQTKYLKWSCRTGDQIFSSPAIGTDGTIYVGSNDNKLYAINYDGSLKWSFLTGDDISSSPAIGTDGTIYVGSRDTNLYAVNPDGSLKWVFGTGDYIYSSPAIGADGTIYVGPNHKSMAQISLCYAARAAFSKFAVFRV